MRVLHTTNHCRFGHGNVHCAVDLACEQARQGHLVAYVSNGGDFEPILKASGVEHFKVNLESKNPIEMFKALIELTRIVTAFKPQILHAQMMNGALLGYVATRLTRTKLVTTVQNAFDWHAFLMALGDRVICVSRSGMELMLRRGASQKKVRIVHNGTLGVARRQSMSVVPVELARPSLTTVCGLHPRKGVQDLLAAFDIISRKNDAVHLYIIGSGPNADEYKDQASRLPHGRRIKFLGQVPDPNPYLLSTDVFVLASHADPCPLVIPEAREAGCAIAGSNVDGIPEMLSVGNAGVLFPPKCPPAMAQAIMSLLDDKKVLEKSKTASFTRIEYFNISRVCDDNFAIYKEIVK